MPPSSLLKNVRNFCKLPVLIFMPRPLTLEIIDFVKVSSFFSKHLGIGRCNGKLKMDGNTGRFLDETETFGLNSETP